jgi:hypothetical protein
MALVELSNLSSQSLSTILQPQRQRRTRQARVSFKKGKVTCISFEIVRGSGYDGALGNRLSMIFYRSSSAGLGKYATRVFDEKGNILDGTIQAVGIQTCVKSVNGSNLSAYIVARFHNESGAAAFSDGASWSDATYFVGGRG